MKCVVFLYGLAAVSAFAPTPFLTATSEKVTKEKKVKPFGSELFQEILKVEDPALRIKLGCDLQDLQVEHADLQKQNHDLQEEKYNLQKEKNNLRGDINILKKAIEPKDDKIDLGDRGDRGTIHEAELGEFLLFLLESLTTYENQNSYGMPESKTKFIIAVAAKIKEMPRAKEFETDRLYGKTHFQKWVWILFKGSEMKSHSIAKLRLALDENPEKYIWFSNQIQNLFKVFRADIGKSPLAIKYMKREKLLKYAQVFDVELRSAIIIFLQNLYFEEYN